MTREGSCLGVEVCQVQGFGFRAPRARTVQDGHQGRVTPSRGGWFILADGKKGDQIPAIQGTTGGQPILFHRIRVGGSPVRAGAKSDALTMATTWKKLREVCLVFAASGTASHSLRLKAVPCGQSPRVKTRLYC